MERHEVLAMMTKLKLAGMRTAYDDILADGLKRRHPVQQIIGALLKAEIADKTARSIKYQMASAKLPAARELAEFDFAASPVNEPLIRDLAMGGFLEAKRNIVLVGGTGTGKTHLAVAIARSCIRKGARGRFYNVVDLVNLLEAELRSGRQGRTADQLTRRDFVILDELGYLPFAQAGGQLLFHLMSRLYERTSIVIYVIWNMALRGLFRTCPAARFPQPRAVRWAKVGRVRPLQGADSRSGATWANNRAKCAGSDFRAWRDWLKGSSGLRSNRCSGWHTTRLRPTGEDWKISCAGVAVREWWRDVRAATTWRATSSTFASVVDLGASGSSHWTRGQACRTRRFSSASRRFDCSSTFSSNRGFATSTR